MRQLSLLLLLCGSLYADIKFVVGGDAYHHSLRRFQTAMLAIENVRPHFVALGGDIAYTDKRTNPYHWFHKEARWETFFRYYPSHLPLYIAVGNHDIKGVNRKQLIFKYFPELKSTYYTVQVDPDLTLIFLDTGHGAPIEGEQAAWLKRTLKTIKTKYKIAIYHIAGYPSYYRSNGRGAPLVRRYFCRLFSEYGVQVAFENDNHCYKVAGPINNVLYLGDGCLSVKPRRPKNRPFVHKALPINHFYVVELRDHTLYIESLTLNGKTIDQFVLDGKTVLENGLERPALTDPSSAPARESVNANGSNQAMELTPSL